MRDSSFALDLDRLIEDAPDAPAVFAIFAEEGEPYLARTTMLRRRLKRLLGPQAKLFSLRAVAKNVEWARTASKLEAAITYYQWAKRYFPNDLYKRVRLRYPSWVKMILSNEFPRTQVTSRLSGGESQFFGPFRTRAAAEAFESKFLDLFQVRRCPEDLAPSEEHPGCIYGEMNLCLRPCQMAVSREEYASEVRRVREFLATGGQALCTTISAARDRASDALEFEDAQRHQKRLEKVTDVLKLRDDLSTDIENLSGIAVLPSVEPGHVRLQPFREGWWQSSIEFALAGAGMSMDTRLREVLETAPARGTVAERNDHCALLTQWFHSSWRDGDWISYPISYRKLVRTINSVSQSSATPANPLAGS